jgi:hypothetical protein
MLYLDSEQILQSQTIPSLPRPGHSTIDVIDDIIGDVLPNAVPGFRADLAEPDHSLLA